MKKFGMIILVLAILVCTIPFTTLGCGNGPVPNTHPKDNYSCVSDYDQPSPDLAPNHNPNGAPQPKHFQKMMPDQKQIPQDDGFKDHDKNPNQRPFMR